jgi:hypothetical protein
MKYTIKNDGEVLKSFDLQFEDVKPEKIIVRIVSSR